MAEKVKDGGPVHPSIWINDSDVNATAPNGQVVPPGGQTVLHGVTLRDDFAKAALPVVLADWPQGRNLDPDLIATAAYVMADAMLRARSQA